jgi:hypothetical protein
MDIPHLIIEVPLPLPQPRDFFYGQVFSLAWPQVLAFSSACVGLVLISLVIRSFMGRS